MKSHFDFATGLQEANLHNQIRGHRRRDHRQTDCDQTHARVMIA